jgi:lipopolysaccharide biosynthesis glycosyltransferase
MYEIVFSVNDKYVDLLSVALRTLLNTNKNTLTINIVYSHLSYKNIAYLKSVCQSSNVEINFFQVDRSDFEGLPDRGHLQVEAYYRMAIPDLIKADKVLYLDCDIMVNGDLEALYSTDLTNLPLAAVMDPVFQPINELGMDVNSTYFNTGVMLINSSYWRENKISKRTMAYLHANPEKITYADQCALNAVVNGNYLSLSKDFNFQSGHIKNSEDLKLINDKAPKIVHFTGSLKPTHYLCTHPLKSEFLFELSQTPFMLRMRLLNFTRRLISISGAYPLVNRLRSLKYIKFLKT